MSFMKVFKTIETDVDGLGLAIKTAREDSDKPLTAICGLVGMSVTNWYRLESESQAISLETLQKIETVLGVNFGVIL